jgi:homoserine dehydrogenase
MTHDRTMTLHFNDGSKLVFEFAEQAPNSAAKQIKLAEFMTSKHLVVEAEGNVLIFPIANIKYIALSGAGAGAKVSGLPKHTITGARIVS